MLISMCVCVCVRACMPAAAGVLNGCCPQGWHVQGLLPSLLLCQRLLSSSNYGAVLAAAAGQALTAGGASSESATPHVRC